MWSTVQGTRILEEIAKNRTKAVLAIEYYEFVLYRLLVPYTRPVSSGTMIERISILLRQDSSFRKTGTSGKWERRILKEVLRSMSCRGKVGNQFLNLNFGKYL